MSFFEKNGTKLNKKSDNGVVPLYSVAKKKKSSKKVEKASYDSCGIVLCAKDLTLSYEGREVVSSLSFEIQDGDYLCIVGENGSGKTTLMDAILGLKKPTSGKIEFPTGVKLSQIGYLPQSSAHQREFPASVKEIVLSGCLNRRNKGFFMSSKDKDLAFESMEKLGITSLCDRCYNELSGGQQQRVMLARSLCAAEKMLLLDEPVSGLDPKATADMYNVIYHENRDNHITVIMVSHDMSAVLKYATKVLDISKPSVFFGTPDEFLKTERGRKLSETSGGDNDKVRKPLYGDSGAYKYSE